MAGGALKSRRADEFLVRYQDPHTEIRVITNPEHPEYDPRVERDVDRDMVASMRRYGQIQAATGYKTGEVTPDGRDVVVLAMGRGRWAAMQALWQDLSNEGEPPEAWPSFRVSVRRYGADIDKVAAAIVENAHREQLSAVETARAVARFLDRTGDDAAALEHARMLFRFPSVVALRNCLALLDLEPEVQQSVASGAVSPTLGLHLSRETPEVQRAVTEQASAAAAQGKPLSVREGREKIRDVAGKAAPAPMVPRGMLDDRISRTESDIDEMTSRLAEDPGEEVRSRLERRILDLHSQLDALRWVAGGWQKGGKE